LRKIDHKTKPLGALGKLEELALKMGVIQRSLSPTIQSPTLIVFAGDHGVTEEKVSSYPKEVTAQMVYNFLGGGAAINVLAKVNGWELKVVDAGVDHDFPDHAQLIRRKIRLGTRNFAQDPAMTREECEEGLEKGAAIIRDLHDQGVNVIGFGEMGIGNTTAAAAIMASLTDLPLEQCVGRGTGLDDIGLARKQKVIRLALDKHKISTCDEFGALQTFGGYEIAMMCGGMIECAHRGMAVVVDGFIVSTAALVASRMEPEILDACIFAHQSGEMGHEHLLAFMNVQPLLNLGLRLGEGSGAALALPLLKSAVGFLNDMASFESAGVSGKI